MTVPAPANVAATAARRLTSGVVLLAALFTASSLLLSSGTQRFDLVRFAAIALTGVLVLRGARWARLLLALLTGLAAAYAAVLALTRALPLGWRAALLVYGVGTLFCLIGLYRQPAAAHFSPRRTSAPR